MVPLLYLQVHLKILSFKSFWIGRRANKWSYKTIQSPLSLSSEVEQQTQELAKCRDTLIIPVLWMLWVESMHLLWKTTWTL
jgi:hypothetical protein